MKTYEQEISDARKHAERLAKEIYPMTTHESDRKSSVFIYMQGHARGMGMVFLDHPVVIEMVEALKDIERRACKKKTQWHTVNIETANDALFEQGQRAREALEKYRAAKEAK